MFGTVQPFVVLRGIHKDLMIGYLALSVAEPYLYYPLTQKLMGVILSYTEVMALITKLWHTILLLGSFNKESLLPDVQQDVLVLFVAREPLLYILMGQGAGKLFT